jgi:hypothetical protein
LSNCIPESHQEEKSVQIGEDEYKDIDVFDRFCGVKVFVGDNSQILQ